MTRGVIFALVAVALSPAQVLAEALPEGAGLAEKYPGDKGIAKDPDVLLAEDFEDGELAALLKKWDEANNKDGKPIALAEGGPEGGGKRCLSVTATNGQDNGGSLYKLLPRGVETAFARFYVKFEAEPGYVHHFVWLGGHNPGTKWPNPRAGTKPEGDERVSIGVEPVGCYGKFPPPGIWNFYGYWQDMKISADQKYWGNGLRPAEDRPAPRDRWQCVEFMVKLNSKPEESDGALALWLDGKLVADFRKGARRGPWSGMGFQLQKDGGDEFEGFRWRKSTDLQLNYFWLEHYVTGSESKQNKADPKKENRVWFDNVVVATKYIGPIRK